MVTVQRVSYEKVLVAYLHHVPNDKHEDADGDEKDRFDARARRMRVRNSSMGCGSRGSGDSGVIVLLREQQ